MTIPIYKKEYELGLAKEIKASTSIAYLTQVHDNKLDDEVARAFAHSVASHDDVPNDQFDLFYLNTVLVTAGVQNKNDDVFGLVPTWMARYSPVHKQFNLEHDQSKIIGHMTSAKVVDQDYHVIPDETPTDELPAKFHILTGAVIYRALSDEEAQANINKIIDEIQQGQWYVSMECLFRDFDYALTATAGEQRIISRNEETAFLTKYLRRYGGPGTYENYTIGRYLKDITFSGKGLVKKPANPDSIIFNEPARAFVSCYGDLAYINSSAKTVAETDNDSIINNDNDINNNELEIEPMADEKDNKAADNERVKSLEALLTEARAEITRLNEAVKQHESSVTTAKISGLEADLQKKVDMIEELKASIQTLTTEVNGLKAEKTNLETELGTAKTEVSTFKSELETIRANEKTRARVDKLVSLNAPKDEATALVELFADKDDAQFETLANLLASKWVVATPPIVEEKAEAKVETVPNAEDVLENAEAETDVAFATNDNVEKTRASMQETFSLLFSPTR